MGPPIPVKMFQGNFFKDIAAKNFTIDLALYVNR